MKKVHNHEDLLDNDPFKDEIAQEPVKHIKPPKPTRKPPPPPIPQVEDHITNVPAPKIKELNRALKGHIKSYDIEQRFRTMDGCHISGEKYTDKGVRVRDHCHITGKFRGSAHQKCNLKLRIKPDDIKIPVIFHNLRGYDSHFIMQRIGEIAKKYALYE